MPEMTFTVRWPDGTVEDCYSPSLVVWDHLVPDAEYPLAEFVERAGRALEEAGDRVRARWGYGCAAAMAQAEGLRARGALQPAGAVRVLAMGPPLPDGADT